MILAVMRAKCETELICDFASEYHIFDIERLPLKTAAALAAGLSRDSRSRRKLAGFEYTFMERMTVRIFDLLSWLQWSKTRSAQKGGRPPEPLSNKLFGSYANDRPNAYNSGKEFERERARILGKR